VKAQTGVNRHLFRPATTIPPRRSGTLLVRRSIAPLVESPGFVYLAGVGLGIGCGGLVMMLLLGVLGL
jgi:hypothetical protein